MKENIFVQKADFVRSGYVAPNTESYAAEPCLILAGTTIFSGTHGDGLHDYGGSGTHDDGELEETITGAKAAILGREFCFSDVWEE